MKLTPLQKARRNYILNMRIWLGLCRNCGVDAPDNLLCDRCHDRRIEKQQRARVRRKERGVCTVCKASLEDGMKYLCYECNIKKYGERECSTGGCDGVALLNKQFCGICFEMREAERQSCKVYFIRCQDCNELLTVKNRIKKICDKCATIRTRINSTNGNRRRNGIKLLTKVCDNRLCNEPPFKTYNSRQIYCSTKCMNCVTKRRESRRRRATRYGAKHIENVKLETLYIRDGGKCQLMCGRKLNLKRTVPHPLSATVDHIIPLSKGGEHSYKNTQLACFMCNYTKSDKHINNGEQLKLFGF